MSCDQDMEHGVIGTLLAIWLLGRGLQRSESLSVKEKTAKVMFSSFWF